MREEILEVEKMWEVIVPNPGSRQRLDGARDPHEVHEFIYPVILRHQHPGARPDQETAQMERQHGLDGPFAVDVVPVMPGDFVDQQDQCQQPADQAFGPAAGLSEEQQDQVEQDQSPQGGEVCGPQILEGRTMKIFSEEVGEETGHKVILHRKQCPGFTRGRYAIILQHNKERGSHTMKSGRKFRTT